MAALGSEFRQRTRQLRAFYNGYSPINYGNGQYNPSIYSNYSPINYGNGQYNPEHLQQLLADQLTATGSITPSIYNNYSPINYGNGQNNPGIL